MAIVLIPWVAGAVVGSVATYLYKDEKIRKDVLRTAQGVSDMATGAATTVTGKVTEGFAGLRSRMFGKPVEKAPASAPKKRATRKKTAAKRKAVKKTASRQRTSRKPAAAAA